MAITVVEELVSVLGLEIGENALSTLTQFRTAVTKGLAGVGGVVAALGAAFAGTVVSVANMGAEINKVALQIGISTDAVQELKYAAAATNVDFLSLTTGLKFLSKNAAEGGEASKRIGEALGGVSMRNANGQLKTADELMEAFADKVAAIKDPIEQVKVAMHGMHGQSGVEKLPLLKLGGAGIRRLREEARDLGAVLSKDTIAASDKFNKSLVKLKYALMGVRNEVGTPFIADFTDAMDWMTDRVRAARGWFIQLAKDIRDLGQRFGRIIEVGKKAFEMIRKFVEQNRLDKLADTIHWMELLEAAIIGIGAISAVTATAFAAEWMIAAAPFIIIATLIGLIIDDIAHFLTGGESVLGMAEKWAKAFDPDNSAMIVFFKRALQLLFDLGDPAKWRRVGDAARDAFRSLTGGGDKTLLEEGIAKPISKKAMEGMKEVSEEVAQPDMGHKILRALGVHNTNKFVVPSTGALGHDDELAAENYLRSKGMLAPHTTLRDLSPTDRSSAESYLKQQGVMAPGASIGTVNITVNGAGDPEKVADHVMRKLDAVNSDAKAAISGGS